MNRTTIVLLVLLSTISVAGFAWTHRESESSAKTETQEPTMATFTHRHSEIAFDYPSDWSISDICVGKRRQQTVALGPNSELVDPCSEDRASLVTVEDMNGIAEFAPCQHYLDVEANPEDPRKTLDCTSVEIKGLSGIRHESLYTNSVYQPAGTLEVSYLLLTPQGSTYKLVYSQRPDYPDELATFEQIVSLFNLVE